MSVESLAASLFSLDGFRELLRPLVVASVASQFPRLTRTDEQVGQDIRWSYMLTCASILARSRRGDCEDTALRIAQSCLTTDTETGMRDAACVVLDTLANRPALNLAQERNLVSPDYESRLPLPLRLDATRRDLTFSTWTSGGEQLFLNRFQKTFWEHVNDAQWLSVSAPTSTGKSFAVGQWLCESLRHVQSRVVVYLVPTRALIQQVEYDLTALFKAAEIDVHVSCLPLWKAVREQVANVFVLTQERLHLLLNDLPDDATIDILIVDEAHKVGDGARGILLEQVLDMISHGHGQPKVVFASPLTSNPELLLDLAPDGTPSESLLSEHTTVNQNLLWASQVPRQPKLWELEICTEEETVPIGRVELPFRPNPPSKRLPFLAYTLASDEGGNLIYVDTPSQAEKAARQLWDLIGADGESGDESVKDLIDLVKKTIHPDYALAEVLSRGVAFHYGNMPLLIRLEVERLFKQGIVRFLVCTSTLVEGVNLPCRSIFVRGPKKGRGRPMTASDFWNLAGRAGRLGREFQGNIICVDPRNTNVWKEPAPKSRSRYAIRRASTEILSNDTGFIEFVENGAPRDQVRTHPEYEQLLSYVALEFLQNDSLNQARICKHMDDGARERLQSAMSTAIATLEVPEDIIRRNPGISPLAIRDLADYFLGYIGDERPVQELLPVLPESEDAVNIYTRILQRINSHLAPVFGQQAFRYAILVVNWMRGHSLARLIRSSIQYHEQRQRAFKLPSLIRQTMGDIEEVARFLAPKYTSCYIDVLRWCLVSTDNAGAAAEIPDLNIWLEFGASQTTHLSLMAIGLSRTSAAAVSELIADDSLDENGVTEWLSNQNLDASDLPRLVIHEIKRVVAIRVSPNDA